MKLKIYTGTPGWGWTMYGIGWGTSWFLGFSKAAPEKTEGEAS